MSALADAGTPLLITNNGNVYPARIVQLKSGVDVVDLAYAIIFTDIWHVDRIDDCHKDVESLLKDLNETYDKVEVLYGPTGSES